jgi:hypothetical protein
LKFDEERSVIAGCSIESSFHIACVGKLVFWYEDVIQLVCLSFSGGRMGGR